MIRKNGAVRTTKPVDCPSGAADNGDMDRFGSRRVWENSQRGCLILRHPKSYLPTHSVIHKSAIRVLAIFADASRTGYAEAKAWISSITPFAPRMQAAQATLRQRATIKLPPSNVMDASRTGYCARQKQTSAARQEIFECVEKQNQWH